MNENIYDSLFVNPGLRLVKLLFFYFFIFFQCQEHSVAMTINVGTRTGLPVPSPFYRYYNEPSVICMYSRLRSCVVMLTARI